MACQRDSMRDQIKKVLLERILDGTYPPGTRLVELQIARELDTSQGPVREALRDLEGLRLVESERYRGTRVRALGVEELKESYQIRARLEELAGELAAPNLKGQTDELREVLSAMNAAAADNDVNRYAEHDNKFHNIILESAGNRMLKPTWESVTLESRFRFTNPNLDSPTLQEACDSHLAIVDALDAGDSKAAGRLLRELIDSVHAVQKELPTKND